MLEVVAQTHFNAVHVRMVAVDTVILVKDFLID
jgi:hypothetical protein